MRNFVASDDNLTMTAPYALTGGQMAKVGAIIGVAAADAASGADVVLSRRGIFKLAKATGETWAQGAKIYWDDTAKKCTTTTTSNTLVGAAFAAAATGDTVGQVVLDGAMR